MFVDSSKYFFISVVKNFWYNILKVISGVIVEYQPIDDWFSRAKQKDHEALTMFYNMYKQELFAFILKKVSSREDCEDIFGDTMEKLFFNFHKIISIHFLRAYMYTIARNMIISYYRKKSKKPETLSIDDDGHIPADDKYDRPEQTLERNADIVRVRAAMAQLPPRQLEVIKYFYDHGKSMKEISKIIGRKPKDVENMLFRGRKRLKDILGKEQKVVI